MGIRCAVKSSNAFYVNTFLVFITFIAGVVTMAVILYRIAIDNDRARVRESYVIEVQHQFDSIKHEFEESLLSLQCLSAIMGAVNITKTSFDNIVSKTPVGVVQALEYAPRVLEADRATFEAEAQTAYGIPSLRIRERSPSGDMIVAGSRAFYYPVHYLYPVITNDDALLYDLASSAERLASINEALAMPEPVLTAPLELVQVGVGILALQRAGTNDGICLAVMNVNTIVSNGINLFRMGGRPCVIMGSESEPIVVTRFNGERDWEAANISECGAFHSVTNSFDIGGRTISFMFVADEAYYDATSSSAPRDELITILSNGIIIAFVFAVVTVSLRYNYDKDVKRIASVRKHKEEKEASEAAFAAKREYMSYILHEIRVPLNAIGMAFQSILLDETSSAGVKSMATEVTKCTHDITRILSDYLDFEKAEAGMFAVVAEPIELRSIAVAAMKYFAQSAQARSVELTSTLEPHLRDLIVMADRTRVHQCLNNFVTNAIKFTEHSRVIIKVYEGPWRSPYNVGKAAAAGLQRGVDSSGGVGLSASTIGASNLTIDIGDSEVEMCGSLCGNDDHHDSNGGGSGTVTMATPDSRRCRTLDTNADDKEAEDNGTILVTFAVRDFGRGIAFEDQELLFRKFSQTVTDQRGKGSGLGLVLTKLLVELQNGVVGFASRLGMGSEFYFTLPLEISGEGVPKPSPSADELLSNNTSSRSSADERKRQVSDLCVKRNSSSIQSLYGHLEALVSEDSVVSTKIMQVLFKRLNLRAKFFGNGAELVQHLRTMIENGEEIHYDFILLDRHMPVMGGIEATQCIRAMGVSLPIIALTGDSDAQVAQEFHDAGAQAVMVKPFQHESLANTLVDIGVIRSPMLVDNARRLRVKKAAHTDAEMNVHSDDDDGHDDDDDDDTR